MTGKRGDFRAGSCPTHCDRVSLLFVRPQKAETPTTKFQAPNNVQCLKFERSGFSRLVVWDLVLGFWNFRPVRVALFCAAAQKAETPTTRFQAPNNVQCLKFECSGFSRLVVWDLVPGLWNFRPVRLQAPKNGQFYQISFP
jgi:hypothetical protein